MGLGGTPLNKLFIGICAKYSGQKSDPIPLELPRIKTYIITALNQLYNLVYFIEHFDIN